MNKIFLNNKYNLKIININGRKIKKCFHLTLIKKEE